jgi:uncharacterized membrane protein
MSNVSKQSLYARNLVEDCKTMIASQKMKSVSILEKIMTIVKILIIHIDDIKQLTGDSKKALLIDVVHELIDQDEGVLDRFDDIIKPIISSAIEELIEVDKNGLKLKKSYCCNF